MNSIRASGGNLNRLDYQAPCESKWWWDNYIILYSNERCTVNGWTTERRASQNDTGWLYHFGSTAFFVCPDCSHDEICPFQLSLGEDFLFFKIFCDGLLFAKKCLLSSREEISKFYALFLKKVWNTEWEG